MNHLEGFAELDRALAALADPKDTGKVLRSGAGAGMRLVKKQAQATIPKGNRAHRTYKGRLVAPGFASRSLTVSTKLSRDKQKVFARLGVKREAFYAVQFLELGTARIARQPWLIPAYEQTKAQAVAKMREAMRRRIFQIARKRGLGA